MSVVSADRKRDGKFAFRIIHGTRTKVLRYVKASIESHTIPELLFARSQPTREHNYPHTLRPTARTNTRIAHLPTSHIASTCSRGRTMLHHCLKDYLYSKLTA